MTTYDPDTLEQDPTVLRRIVRGMDGRLALDSSVLQAGPPKACFAAHQPLEGRRPRGRGRPRQAGEIVEGVV